MYDQDNDKKKILLQDKVQDKSSSGQKMEHVQINVIKERRLNNGRTC